MKNEILDQTQTETETIENDPDIIFLKKIEEFQKRKQQ